MIPPSDEKFNRSLDFLEGETFPGVVQFEVIDQDTGVAPTTDAASARMQFRDQGPTETVYAELSTANGLISMTSANGWTFTIPATDSLDLKAGVYDWYFQVTDVAGNSISYACGNIVVGTKGII